jgi:hypothetical protein
MYFPKKKNTTIRKIDTINPSVRVRLAYALPISGRRFPKLCPIRVVAEVAKA